MMTLARFSCSFFIGFALWACAFSLAEAQNVPADLCYTPEEKALYDAIDAYRKETKQATIPYSKSLSYVAKLHAQDLFNNRKDSDECSMNSWSDQGFWTACCHSDTPEKSACMWEKPREIAGYEGYGYELIYNGGGNAEKILERWKNSRFFADMLVNQGRWADKDWVAIGIGKYENYMVVWFGEAIDPLGAPTACKGKAANLDPKAGKANTNEAVKSDMQATQKTGKFYLVYGSYGTEENANIALNGLKNKGFADAKVLVGSNGRYRIALAQYKTKEEARKAQDELDFSYVGAWVLEE
jgi:hypothetical protein